MVDKTPHRVKGFVSSDTLKVKQCFLSSSPVGCNLVQPQVRLGKDITGLLQQTHGRFNSGKGFKALIYIKIMCHKQLGIGVEFRLKSLDRLM